jgi:UDP-galactopyranose mutase
MSEMPPTAAAGRRALILSFVEWAGAFQRPQHLAVGLARRGWQVTYAAPGYLHRRGKRVANGLRLPRNLNVVEPPALPGNSRSKLVAALNRELFYRAVKRTCGGGVDLLIFNDARWANVAARLPARRRVFDCMDDLSGIVPDEAQLRRLEGQALRTADRIWTGTSQLAERFGGEARALGKPLQFIACGVDAKLFANPTEAPRDLEELLPKGPGPLAGYFGAINERLDVRLLEALLNAGWRVLLIGPGTSRAPALPNDPRLKWIGGRPYAELPAWLARFDLALIPYDYRGAHRFLYPVKALEYLAGGKPVLSTPLPDVVRFLSGYVELADTPQKWREAGERLKHMPEEVREKTRAGQTYAATRSWGAMVDEMLADVERKA